MQQEKHSKAMVLGLQHLLAMYSGSILVPMMIGQALGYNSEQLTYLVSTDIFMCGVATFLQLQLNKYFGIGLRRVRRGVSISCSINDYRTESRKWSHVWRADCLGDFRCFNFGNLLKTGELFSCHCYRLCDYNHWTHAHSGCHWKYGK